MSVAPHAHGCAAAHPFYCISVVTRGFFSPPSLPPSLPPSYTSCFIQGSLEIKECKAATMMEGKMIFFSFFFLNSPSRRPVLRGDPPGQSLPRPCHAAVRLPTSMFAPVCVGEVQVSGAALLFWVHTFLETCVLFIGKGRNRRMSTAVRLIEPHVPIVSVSVCLCAYV